MSIKIQNENPTNHVFIGLMDYRVDYNYSREHCYQFGYFIFNHSIIQSIYEFLDNWDKGIRKYDAVVFHLDEMYLIDSDFVHSAVEKAQNHSFCGVKLDSINFLKSKPKIAFPKMIKAKGSLVIHCDHFHAQCEAIDNGFPTTIYKSGHISFQKINHILKSTKSV